MQRSGRTASPFGPRRRRACSASAWIEDGLRKDICIWKANRTRRLQRVDTWFASRHHLREQRSDFYAVCSSLLQVSQEARAAGREESCLIRHYLSGREPQVQETSEPVQRRGASKVAATDAEPVPLQPRA